MKTTLTLMNLPPPVTKKLFKICSDYSQSREDCSRIMNTAKGSKTINGANDTANFDISISNDGAY